MRMVLGLDAPTAGEALVGGRPYRTLRGPLHEVGALLDANAAHTLPVPWNTRVGSYMLQTAAEQMTSLHRNPALLSPTWSAVVLTGYVVAALGLAAWLINRRDA